MAEVSLGVFKKELRMSDDFTEQDDILSLDLDAAEASVLKMCNRTLDDIKQEYGQMPADLMKAVLALAKHMYSHDIVADERSLQATPYGISVLVKPYTRLTDA